MANKFGPRWGMPPRDELLQAQRVDPTGAAAADLTNEQGNKSRYNKPAQTSTGGFLGSGGGTPSSAGVASPGSYNTQGMGIGFSPEWYGKRNDYGQDIALSGPEGFWSGYGADVMGLDPGGFASGYLANKYNTDSLAAAFFGGSGNGQEFFDDDSRLAAGTAVANRLTGGPGGAGAFIDAGTVIQQVLGALSSHSTQAQGAAANPVIGGLMAQMAADPASQPQVLAGFLQEVLSGSMQPDALDALITMIQRIGMQWVNELGKGPIGNIDNKNFASYLAKTLGPTLGL